MTAQMPDSFLLQDKKYSIAGVNGVGLYVPQEHNLEPLPRITSCWRGYVCTYKSPEDKLVLDTLQVNLGRAGPPIEGVEPVFSNSCLFDNTYKEMDLPVNFTGGLLVADGFVHDLYVHMGFHPAWKYETVFELVVSQGRVLETSDVSREMSELRTKLKRQPLEPGQDASSQDVSEWIASTFRRSYRF